MIRLLTLFCYLIFYGLASASLKPGMIGHPCIVSERSQCILSNSQCIEGICMCSSFYKYINGSCVTDKSKTLGQHCRGGADCTGEGEFCSSFSVCMCLGTHVDVGNQCKPVIYPGQFGCEDTLQCNKGFPGAECDVSRICVCPHGMFVNQQTCMKNESNSTRKEIERELMLQNVIMADHRQVNRSEFRGNFFRRKHFDLPRSYQVAPDSTCSYDNQCAGYPLAICDSICKCVHGALNTGTMCISSSKALQSSVSCPAGQTYIREAGVCMTAQQPGEPCQYSQQCSALEPGAYCLKMRCECVYGMKQSNNGCTFVNNDCKERGHIFISEIGECREVIPPGAKGCSHNLQCSGAYPDATCFMQTCTCPPNLPVAADGTCGRSCSEGYVYSGVTGECLPEVQLGEACLYSSQCQSVFGGLVCDKNQCRCPNGLIFDGSKCSQTCANGYVIEKDICVSSCSAENVNVNGRCAPKVAIGHQCLSNAQCSSGSFCQDGSCLCPPGFYVINEQCKPVESEPSGSCANNEKCTKGSVCYNGKCVCPRNQELVNGFCQPNRAAIQAYNNAVDNIRRIRLRFSSQSKYMKNPTNTNNEPLSEENSKVPIGSACVRIGVSCDGGSVCVAGVCVCPLGKTPKNGICVKHVIALPGNSCENGEECIENGICNEKTWTCECVNPSQMVVGNRCVERLRSHPGYGCSFGELCVGNSICVDGKCACAAGKVEVNKICIDNIFARIGEICGKGIICKGGSYCSHETNTCSCSRGQKEIEGECRQVKLVFPGEVCTDLASRCTGGSYCVHGRCECPFSMQLLDRKCVIQQVSSPGEKCTETTICSGQSVCRGGVCSCLNEMIIRNKQCVQQRKVSIGGSCDEFDHCLGNSNCSENHCQCPPGEIVANNVCSKRKTVTPGYLCNPEDICTGNSICVKGVCQCKPNFKQINSICIKHRIGVEGSSCSTKSDCGEGLGCNNGICTCPGGTFSYKGGCKKFVELEERCTTDDRCKAENAQCIKDQCTCKSGYFKLNEECVAQIVTPAEPEKSSQMKSGLIGHFCQNDKTCKVANSFCRRSVCMCKDGYRIFGSTQCIPRVAKGKEKPTTKMPAINRLVNLGEKCDRLLICQKGAICENGKCVCPETFVELNGVCSKNATIKVIVPPLSTCINGEICSGNSECVHGICFCKEDYTLFHGKCQKLESLEILRIIDAKRGGLSIKSSSTTSSSTTTKPSSPSPTLTPIRISLKLTPQSITPTIETVTSTSSTTVSTTTSPFSSSPSTPDSQISTSFWFKIVKPGRACDNLSFCTNCSVCISGFCVCPEGLELHGDRCVSHIDAQKCVASNQCPSGANCVRGECKCKPGLGLSRFGFCIPINYADPGTSCAHGERCRSESTCLDGICVCNEPLILKENKCIRSPREKRFTNDKTSKLLRFTPKKKAQLGEYCIKNEHCEPQKQCLNNVCKCSTNFVQTDFNCIPRMSVISKVLVPGEACFSGLCIGGSTCVNGICKCPGEYFKLGDTCARIESKIGTPCGTTTGCASGSECVSSYCQCQNQYDANNDECYPQSENLKSRTERRNSINSKRLNRVVSASSLNCPIGFDYVNGMCVNSETLSVIQLSEPGGSCEDGRVLCTGNSVCANNVCICPGGEIVRNGSCISFNSFSSPGDPCDLENSICTGNSKCLDGICKCANGQGALNGKCSNIGIVICGQKQCGNNQICYQDKCQCKIGFIQQPAGCVSDQCNCVPPNPSPIVPLIDETSNCQRQCGQNQICAQNLCACKPGYYQQPETCIADRCNCVQRNNVANSCVGNGCSPSQSFSPFFGLPGQMCDLRPSAIMCRNNALCVNNQCICPSDKVISGTNCVTYLGDALPGQSCHVNGIICKGGSTCNQNMCQCQNGFSPIGNSCVPIIQLQFTLIPNGAPTPPSPTFNLNPGQSCNPTCSSQPCLQQCSGGSVCTNSVCTCPQGTFLLNNACSSNNQADNGGSYSTKTARPGESCDNTIVCVGGSSCVIGTCSCDLGYTPSSDRSSCILIGQVSIKSRSYPKSSCKFDTDCPNSAICIDKRCNCRDGETLVNGKCELNNTPGSRCRTSHCINGAECLNGYCVCAKTQFSNSTLHCVNKNQFSSLEIMYPGSKCDKSTICQNNSTCHQKYCVRLSDENDHIKILNQQKQICQSYKDCKKLETCSKDGYCECFFNTNLVNGECVAQIPIRRAPSETLTPCPYDDSCKLPNCYCTANGKLPPNNFDVKKVPQMIVLTFDDPITDRIINTLKSLFSGKIRNPNGCAIKGTFFISHQWNNYDQSQWLFSKGNEISVNSITREDLSERTKERWIREQKGMRDTISEFSYVDKSDIVGTRAPSFKIGGDVQFEMMSENNFTFDNSMQVNGLYWPQTLDHKLAWECDGKCPQRSHKGIWELPIQNIQANDGMWYSTMSQALKPSDSRLTVKQMLMRNFLNNYKSNRAPFVLTLNTDFLTYLPDNGAIYALEDFLKEIVQRNDVFIVTASQVIDWMKNPTEVQSIKSLKSWQCNFLLNDHVQPCESPSICSYNSRAKGQLAHSFRICGSCPKKYPWI